MGAALAVAAGAPFDVAHFAWGQVVVTAAQLMTHYANDFFDLEADRANRTPTAWSGGSRMLPTGALPPRGGLVAGPPPGRVAPAGGPGAGSARGRSAAAVAAGPAGR